LKTEVVRITKDLRINVPTDFANIMNLESDSFLILKLDEQTKILTVVKAKVVPDIDG